MKFLIGIVCFIALTRQSVLGYPNDDPSKKDVGSHNVQSVNSFSDKIFNLIKTIYTTELDTDIALQNIDNVTFDLPETIDITYERKNFSITFKNITVSLSTPVQQIYDCSGSEPIIVHNSLDRSLAIPYYKIDYDLQLKSKETSDVTNFSVHVPPRSYGNKGKRNQTELLELALQNSYNGQQSKTLSKISPRKFPRDTDAIKSRYTKVVSGTCSQIENQDIFHFVITNFNSSSTLESYEAPVDLDFNLGPVEVKSLNTAKKINFSNHANYRSYIIFAFNVTLRGTYGKNNSQGVYEEVDFEYTIDHLKIEAVMLAGFTGPVYEWNVGVYMRGSNHGDDIVGEKILGAVGRELRISFSTSLEKFYNGLGN